MSDFSDVLHFDQIRGNKGLSEIRIRRDGLNFFNRIDIGLNEISDKGLRIWG
jgi:hypothetical protein